MGIAADVSSWLREYRTQVIEWRRYLHSHPELSNEEFATTDFIESILLEHGLAPVRFPGTGLYVDIGPETEGKLAFRADIDALPIAEATGLEFTSQRPGVSHSCGHDVHTTIALALACALSTLELPQGVRVIFQPAEEVMNGGASDVIAWGGLQGVGSIFALHVEPKLRVGKVGVRTGAITSATDVIDLEISGPGGHTSRPHLTSDVVYALGNVITQLPALLSRRVDPRTGTVLVFGQVESGFAPNAIPQTGRLRGTLRTADIGIWRTMETLVAELVDGILAPTGCSHKLTYHRGVPPVLNDDIATALLADAGRAVDPQGVVDAPQSSGGEDFSWYLEHVPGSMGRLGCWSGEGDRHDLHQGDLLVDERSIGVGVRLFGSVVERFFSRPARPGAFDGDILH
ncbi:M20 family metallopeptidase [Corynebacterium breve]|uniref:M20 family metallopeptidase n=1 Tax=Corynebacterium breve TaxID=3049799 RepID=A0ABY8VGI4_9CORY|nr:M20 family metallopeptidase [Corynebacterium breve]WIM68212.1 M20 family metallopeptidase [Corynebacterium breve]